jgi:hypothetical protein
MEKFSLDIYESGIRVQIIDFNSKEERENYLAQFKCKFVSYSNVYKFPYNPNLTAQIVDTKPVKLEQDITLENWITSKQIEGRFAGNTEWPKPISYSVTGSFATGLLHSYSGLASHICSG